MTAAGSRQPQRIQFAASMQLDYKKRLAKALAGIDSPISRDEVVEEMAGYFARVFKL